jgi:hypothetical protein
MPKRITRIQPFLLALILALGFGIVWAVLVMWAVDRARDILAPEKEYEYVQFRRDGTPVVRSIIGRGYSENYTYRTLDGNPITIPREERWLRSPYLAGPKDREYSPFGRAEWTERIESFNDRGQPLTYWYFLLGSESPGTGYFVGFDSLSRQRIGYIGRSGFQAERPSSEQCFPVHSREVARKAVTASSYYNTYEEPHWAFSFQAGSLPPWMAYVLADDGLVEVDLVKRSTRVVLKETGLLSAGRIARSITDTGEDAADLSEKEFLAVRGQDRVLIFDADGKPAGSFTIPAELRDVRFEFYLLGGQSAVLDVSAYELERVSRKACKQDRLVWIDPAGKTVRRVDYSLGRSGSDMSPWQLAVSVPVPLAPIVGAAVAAVMFVVCPEEMGVRSETAESDFPAVSLFLAIAAILVLGGVLARLCYRRQRRYALPGGAAWAAFVFLGGVPGFVAYLWHRHWPVLEPCPACGRPAPRDREDCCHCGAEFPRPEPKGVEVFA